METLRILVSIPVLIADALYGWLTRDEQARELAEIRADFLRLTDGE